MPLVLGHTEEVAAGLLGLAVVERRHIDTELTLSRAGNSFFDLFFEVLAAGKVHAAFLALFLEHGAVGPSSI
jgi:hypothetical protein